MICWKRTLKTLTSERFLALRNGDEIAAVDLHYLSNGSVAGTVVVLKGANLTEKDVSPLLKSLDEDLLPDVALEEGNLIYTVVVGELVGNYERITDETK